MISNLTSKSTFDNFVYFFVIHADKIIMVLFMRKRVSELFRAFI